MRALLAVLAPLLLVNPTAAQTPPGRFGKTQPIARIARADGFAPIRILAFEPTPDGQLLLLWEQFEGPAHRVFWQRTRGRRAATFGKPKPWLGPTSKGRQVGVVRHKDALHITVLEETADATRLCYYRQPLSATKPDRAQCDLPLAAPAPGRDPAGSVYVPGVAAGAVVVEWEKEGHPYEARSLAVLAEEDGAFRPAGFIAAPRGLARGLPGRVLQAGGRPEVLVEGSGFALPHRLRLASGKVEALPVSHPVFGPRDEVFGAHLHEGPTTLGFFANVDHSQPRAQVQYSAASYDTRRRTWGARAVVSTTEPGHLGPPQRLAAMTTAAAGPLILVGVKHLRVAGDHACKAATTWERVFGSADGGKSWLPTKLAPDAPDESSDLHLRSLPGGKEIVAVFVKARIEHPPSKVLGKGPPAIRYVDSIVFGRMRMR